MDCALCLTELSTIFHAFLTRHASKFCIEQISLVEIGRSTKVIEQGVAVPGFADSEMPDVLEDESLADEAAPSAEEPRM